MNTEYMGDWPYTQEADRAHQQQLEERQRVEVDIKDAWANVEHDLALARGFAWSSESDLKLLRWALGLG